MNEQDLNKALLAKIVECTLLQERVAELRMQNDALEREMARLKAPPIIPSRPPVA